MPESGENFVLITDRLSPSTLSSAYSLNEVSTVGINRYTRYDVLSFDARLLRCVQFSSVLFWLLLSLTI